VLRQLRALPEAEVLVREALGIDRELIGGEGDRESARDRLTASAMSSHGRIMNRMPRGTSSWEVGAGGWRTSPWLAASQVAIVALLLVRPPLVGDPIDLDSSWQGILLHDWSAGARAGVDTVFPYGPLGFIVGQHVLQTEGLWVRLLAGLLLAVAVAAGLSTLAPRLPSGWRIGYRIAVVLSTPFLGPSALCLAMAAAGIVGVLRLTEACPDAPASSHTHAHAARRGWLFLGATFVMFAVTGCVRFNCFVLAVAIVATIACALLVIRGAVASLAVVGMAVAVFAVVWLLAGQSLCDLPAWLQGSVAAAVGHNGAMALYGDERQRAVGIALVVVNVALAGLLLVLPGRPSPHRPWGARVRRWSAVAIALAGLGVAWKGGFVRHDPAHASVFFGYAMIAPLLLLAASEPVRLPRWAGSLAIAAVLAAAWQACDGGSSVADRVAQALGRARAAVAPGATVAAIEQDLAKLRALDPLPGLRSRVGDEPVDLMGHSQGVLLWGGFVIRHRPVFQSYIAYTPSLQQLNADFFAAATAPRFVIAVVQAADDRPAMCQDARAWSILLDRYRPVASENGAVLLERAPAEALRPAAPAPVVVERRVDWDTWVEVPAAAERHELALGIEGSWWGIAVALCFRPADVFLDLRLEHGEERTFTIASLQVRSAFALDPWIGDTVDLLSAYAGRSPPRVRAFRLRSEAGSSDHYRPWIDVRLTAHPATAATLTAAERDRCAALLATTIGPSYPNFSWLPFAVVPRDGVRPLDGKVPGGVLAPAPCTMWFRWPGGRHRLVGQFELLPEAGSDSATFRVEVGAHAPRTLFERTLHGSVHAADRGPQSFELDLELDPDAIVALVTAGGSGGMSGRWTAWRSVALWP